MDRLPAATSAFSCAPTTPSYCTQLLLLLPPGTPSPLLPLLPLPLRSAGTVALPPFRRALPGALGKAASSPMLVCLSYAPPLVLVLPRAAAPAAAPAAVL